MIDLKVVSDSFEYLGMFSEPPMALWGQTHLLVGGLYDTLTSHSVSLRDIRVIPGSDNAADGVVSISIGGLLVEFRFDSFRMLVSNGSLGDIERVSAVLHDLRLWLERAADVDLVSHAIGYSAHGTFLDGSTSETFLGRLPKPPVWPGAVVRPAGVICHYVSKEWLPEARITLTLDHSLQVPGGLWVAAVATHDGRGADISQALRRSPVVFADLLSIQQLRILDLEKQS